VTPLLSFLERHVLFPGPSDSKPRRHMDRNPRGRLLQHGQNLGGHVDRDLALQG